MQRALPTSLPAHGQRAPLEFFRSAAFSIQLARNRIVQALGLGMVSLMVLRVLPWPYALAWTLAAVATVGVEHQGLKLLARA